MLSWMRNKQAKPKNQNVRLWQNVQGSIRAFLVKKSGQQTKLVRASIQQTGVKNGEFHEQPIFDWVMTNDSIYVYDGVQASKQTAQGIRLDNMLSVADNTLFIEPGLRYVPKVN